MISFTYDQKYKVSSFNYSKKKTENLIRKYILDKFKPYVGLEIQIILLPDNFFKYGIVATINITENKINFNFHKLYDYLIHLKRRNNKLLMPDIKYKRNYIFNALHHEIQHITNHIEHSEVFNYIKEIDSYGYVKVGISNLLDEYMASYSTQKQFFNSSSSGAVDELIRLCEQRDKLITSVNESQKISLFIDIVNSLAYAVAECKVLYENNNNSKDFDNLLEDKNTTAFSEIFFNIKNLLENYNF